MTSKWVTSTIAEVCLLVTDGSHFSPKSVSRGRYMVSVKDFTPDGFDFSNCRQISEEDYLKLEKGGCVPEYDDILIGKDGARFFEDIVIYRQNERPALLSSIAILRCNKSRILPEFLYYTLRTPSFRADVRDNYGSGSAIPRIILKDFKRMPVLVPPVEEQQQIADTLSVLDARIAENRKINHHLEQMAQAIFKSWFVDFEPFGGEMPDNWRKGKLSDICVYNSERIPVSALTLDTYISTENMSPNKGGFTSAASLPTVTQTTAFDIGDILVSNIRPYFKKIVYCGFAGGCSTDVLCFRPHRSNLSLYVFNTLYNDGFFDYIVAGSKGTKMPRGDKQQIMSYQVAIPSDAVVDEFSNLAAPMIEKRLRLMEESTRLADLRDTLLPRLMSGQLSVADI